MKISNDGKKRTKVAESRHLVSVHSPSYHAEQIMKANLLDDPESVVAIVVEGPDGYTAKQRKHEALVAHFLKSFPPRLLEDLAEALAIADAERLSVPPSTARRSENYYVTFTAEIEDGR